jgi:tetrahydromethanopterin S-methyltransferase subunit H
VFEKEQKIFDAGGIKVGGQPGELPTVLTATIFYRGHKIVSDKKKGIFDKARAETLINRMEELSDMTTNPFILDVVGSSVEAYQNYIDFISKVTEAPIQVDALSPRVRLETIKWASEVGLSARLINNSIYPDIVPKVLPLADQAGIECPLIDTAMPPWGIGIGAGLRSIYLIKEQYGDRGAVGTGIGNVSDTLGWAKGYLTKDVRKATDAAQNAILPMIGADWIMFGPIEFAEFVFPAVAIIDTYILTATAELGIKPAIEGMHPLFKLVG